MKSCSSSMVSRMVSNPGAGANRAAAVFPGVTLTQASNRKRR
jgi:hypothetical protein